MQMLKTHCCVVTEKPVNYSLKGFAQKLVKFIDYYFYHRLAF